MNAKEEALQTLKSILNKTPQGFPVKSADFNYLVNMIFPLHPKWKDMTENGRWIKLIVVKTNQYGSKYFSALLSDGTYENVGIYDCINRKGLRDDIISAARSAVVGIEAQEKKKHPEFSVVVRNWADTIDGEELCIGRYIVEMPNGEKRFNNQDIINSFIQYYIENG